MKLTRKARRELLTALECAVRAEAYVFSERMAVCRVETSVTTTLHLTRPYDDRVLYEVEREYGSELCLLRDATRKLRDFLDSH